MPNFKVVDFNPNDTTGGGGCLCSETKTADTNAPYVVFYGDNEMDSTVSPVPVLCAGCVRNASAELDRATKPAPATRRPRKESELPEL